jgi:hypothetical protein
MENRHLKQTKHIELRQKNDADHMTTSRQYPQERYADFARRRHFPHDAIIAL